MTLAAATTQADELLVADFDRLTASSTGFTAGTNGTANACATTGTSTYSTLPAVQQIQTVIYPMYCIVTATGTYRAAGLFDVLTTWSGVMATYCAPPTPTPTATGTPTPTATLTSTPTATATPTPTGDPDQHADPYGDADGYLSRHRHAHGDRRAEHDQRGDGDRHGDTHAYLVNNALARGYIDADTDPPAGPCNVNADTDTRRRAPLRNSYADAEGHRDPTPSNSDRQAQY